MTPWLLALLAPLFTIFSSPPDAGSGAGAGGSASSSSGASGAGGTGSGRGGDDGRGGGSGTGTDSGRGTGAAAADRGGSAQAIRLSPDTLVDLGDGQAVRWSDLTSGEKARFVSRESYDRGVSYLEQVAGQLDKREQQLLQRLTAAQQGQTAAGGNLPPTDPFAEIEGMAIIDGKTLANMARKLSRDGFGQLAQAITGLASKVTALEKSHGTTAQHTQQLTDRDYQQQFDRAITGVLGKLPPIKGLPDGVTMDTASPFLRDLAANLWLSHEQDSWRAGEFEKMLSQQIETAIAFVRTLDKAAVEQGNERRRRFLSNPNRGGARPSSEPGYRHQTGGDLANMLFHGAEAART